MGTDPALGALADSVNNTPNTLCSPEKVSADPLEQELVQVLIMYILIHQQPVGVLSYLCQHCCLARANGGNRLRQDLGRLVVHCIGIADHANAWR